jgi:hypothetical protein
MQPPRQGVTEFAQAPGQHVVDFARVDEHKRRQLTEVSSNPPAKRNSVLHRSSG